jgi:hypothetical protein
MRIRPKQIKNRKLNFILIYNYLFIHIYRKYRLFQALTFSEQHYQ